MRIGIIGCGAIGSWLAKRIAKDKQMQLVFVYDTDPKKTKAFKQAAHSMEACLKKRVDIVVEAASQSAAKSIAPALLAKTNLLLMSVGALADQAFEKRIRTLCKKSGKRIFIPSGAVVGIDGILAVRDHLKSVQLTTIKNPAALGRRDKVRKKVYDGPARIACVKFPQNVNVAATLALAGLGFDRTRVEIISDPGATRNTHIITASGDFGRLVARTDNVPTPKNRKTSFLASLSAFAALSKQTELIRII